MFKIKNKLFCIFTAIILSVAISFNFTSYADYINVSFDFTPSDGHTDEMIFYAINNNEVTITAGGNLNDVSIPSHIDNYPVTRIASMALMFNSSYTSISLPETLITIDRYAIFCCENIKDITIPKSVKQIETYALGYHGEIIQKINDEYVFDIYKVSNMIIRGYTGTVAETYAKENGFTFIALDESEVTTTVTTSTSTTTETTISTTVTPPIETTVSTTTSTENTTTPTVTTAITTTSAVSNTIAEQTTTTETTSITTTAATTEITTTTTKPIKIKGDANGDNKLNVRDCAYIARMLAKGKKEEIPENADFNGDEIIDVRDAAAIARYLASK